MGNPLFTLSGNQGNSWTQGQMSIPQVTASQGYKVSFFFIITQNIENIPVFVVLFKVCPYLVTVILYSVFYCLGGL